MNNPTLKVRAQIVDDRSRANGKNNNGRQAVTAMTRNANLPVDLHFIPKP
jgi:uncharacterized protein YajQ (UPF0234 family)